jgi:hypothetical protein
MNKQEAKKTYQIVNGTHYHIETPQTLINVLENARLNKVRIVLDYGDTKSGKSWGESNHIRGYIGRSMGPIKIPLLIYNKNSNGGGGILDHCILSVRESKGGKILYSI